MNGRTFRIDRAEGKLLGVCAGIANFTGVDATLVRVALVVATIAGGWPWTVIGYGVLAWFGHRAADRQGHRAPPSLQRDDGHVADLRLRAAEHVAASSNSRLAREIEELR